MAFVLQMVVAMNFRSISVAMGPIVQDIGAGAGQELWLPDAYLTALIVATPIGALMTRRFGPRATLTACTGGLIVASVIMSGANTIASLTALLFLQGLLAAPIAPTTQSLIVAQFTAKQRGLGMAIWSTGGVAGVFTGSLAGGYIAEQFNWRGVFLIGVPVGLAGLALVFKVLPRGGGEEGLRIDWRAILLLGGGLVTLGAFLNLLDNAGTIGTATLVGLAVFSIVSLALFGYVNARAPTPLLHLELLRRRQLTAVVLIVLGGAALNFGFLETQALTDVMNFDAEQVGNSGAIRALANLTGVALGARLVMLGHSRLLIAFALGIMAAGKFGTTLYVPDTTFFAAMWPLAMSQVGLGLGLTALAVIAFDTIPPALVVGASSMFAFSRVIGNALGLASVNTARVFRQKQLVAAGASQTDAMFDSFIDMFRLGTVLIIVALMPLVLLLHRRRMPAPE